MACSIPFHAVEEAGCQWQYCEPGYYITATNDPTCRQCSVSTNCAAGYVAQPCTNFSDFTCDVCPRVVGNVYGTNCELLSCDIGWWNSPTGCAICPQGSFCNNNIKIPCGSNCSTLDIGASSPMQCQGSTSNLLQVTLPVYANVDTGTFI